MKLYLIIFTLFMFPLLLIGQTTMPTANAFEQYNKGNNLLSFKLIATRSFPARISKFSYSARYGRFWVDNFNAGIGTGINFALGSIYGISVEPYVRQYLMSKPFSPFMELNYKRTEVVYPKSPNGKDDGIEWKGNANSFFIGGGLAYAARNELLGLELYGGFEYASGRIRKYLEGYSTAGFMYGIQLNFHF